LPDLDDNVEENAPQQLRSDGGFDDDEYEWKIICWIDSKVWHCTCSNTNAVPQCYRTHVLSMLPNCTLSPVCHRQALFGDIDTHTNSVLPQVETYVHRFGPGLVIYWFGHAPLTRLGDGHGDVQILDDLPDLFLMPTGEFRGRGGRALLNDC
jgi:hypothetical protein